MKMVFLLNFAGYYKYVPRYMYMYFDWDRY